MSTFIAKFVETDSQFNARLYEPNVFTASFGEIQTVRIEDWYEGDYEVTPTPDPQTLETAGLTMKDDVQVKGIPYYRTSNEYGYTVYIGSEV